MRRAILAALFLAAAGPAIAQPPAQPPAQQPAQPPAKRSEAFDAGDGVLSREALKTDRPVLARHAMVVSAEHYATEAGLSILKQGGNAVDAAVAIGYALAVVHPCCGNLGGGGFMTIHLADGRNLFLNFREKAPLKATATMFQDANGQVVPGLSTNSWLSIGVPGTVMGLNEALSRYGTMRRAEVMAPAIALARDGYTLSPQDVDRLSLRNTEFAKDTKLAAIFTHDGKPYVAGEVLKQPDLANTLQMIAAAGDDAFYRGPIAKAIVAASAAHGGLLSLDDFAHYSVEWRAPVNCAYRGYQVVSAPPPSSGGVTVCEILNIVSAYPFRRWGYGAVKTTHYFVEAERRAFADRNTDLGDPDFVTNPLAVLLSPSHAAALRAGIKADRATPSAEISGSPPANEGAHTTHASVIDAKGDAVALTYTINRYFGVGKIAGDTGFFLNDEMDDFTSKPGVANMTRLVQGKTNEIAPGKRPLSSMSPTIVLKAGKPVLVTGSPGSSTIISTVAESILNTLEFGMNAKQAVDAPRVHHQWLPDLVIVEPGYLTDATKAKLTAMGYAFHGVSSFGADEAIYRDPKTGMLEGANDARRPAGLAAGY